MGLEWGSKTVAVVLMSLNNFYFLGFLILTFAFYLILGLFFTFWGPEGVFFIFILNKCLTFLASGNQKKVFL